MLTLTLRTDKPEAEIGLYDQNGQILYYTWQAHRQLAETIHTTIVELLESKGFDWHDITGVVVYKGPGSFTGLRIGISVANALAEGLNIPISGQTGEDWQQNGLQKLAAGTNDLPVVPDYGAPVHITQQKR